jgi:hypothetical protein
VSRRSRCGAAVTLVAALACAGSPPPAQPVPALAPEEISTTLYLIGDAGKPDSTGEPVLEALGRELETRRSERVVLFLGDNAYPRGLPAPNQPGRHEAEFNLTAQVRTITRAGARGFFVPGNHDWAKHGKDGWDAIKRQEQFIDSLGGTTVSMKPGGGCPGPSVVDVGQRLRLVMLDTQWWLHPGPKPEGASSGCETSNEAEVVQALAAAVAGAPERIVVVAQHHPLASGGPHGGHFTWMDHLFPLREINSSLWIPLPLIGSLYPTARAEGISPQDVNSRAYQHMIESFRRAFRSAPPALEAAGHEHNQQVIKRGATRVSLVSGTGIYGHTSPAVAIHGSLFASNASGFARLDIPRHGRARLSVLVVDRTGSSREAFSTWVE